jgi:hypothetical protein
VYPAFDLYASVVLLLAASAVVGQGVLCACGRRTWSWLAPAVGLATLVILAGATIRLPGRDLTATAVAGVALAASLALLWVRRPPAPGGVRVGLAIALAIVVAASLPFAAGGGFGAFVGKSRDLGYYLYDAQWLQTHDGFRPPQIAKGFPMGPPALAVVTAKVAANASLVASFTAFMIAATTAAALASLTVFGALPAGRRTLTAFLVGLPYMAASFYVQSSFKEVAMGLFALAFALSLREFAGEDRPEGAAVSPGSLAGIFPLGLLLGAAVYTYSFAGTYWPLGTLGLWVLALLVLNRSRLRALVRGWRLGLPRSRRARIVVALGLVAVLAASIAQWNEVIEFARARGSLGALSGGDVSGDLPGTPWFYTALGVWPVTDYRAPVPDLLVARLLFAVGLVALARGLLLLCRRGEFALLSAAVAVAVLYLAARVGSGPYVQSKALAIMAPLTMLIAAYGALTVLPRRRRGPVSTSDTAPNGARATAGRLLAAPLVWVSVAVVFLGGALFSTYLALGGTLVDGGEQTRQLEALGRKVQGSTVLFLGSDDYVGWELRGASVFASGRHSGVALLPTRATPTPERTRYDFDSMRPAELDLADFVITARSPLMSQAPPNFKRVAATESFELWQRVGPTAPRRTLREDPLPGQELRCGTARGRRLSRSRGVARVWSRAPVYGLGAGWRASSGPTPAAGFRRLNALVPGRSLTQSLDLDRGRWAISLQYHSADPLRVRGPGLDARLPPNSQRTGSFWRVGTIALRKPGLATFRVESEPRSDLRDLLAGPDGLDTGSDGLVAAIAATRVGGRRATVPLPLACGRFVDWYRVS